MQPDVLTRPIAQPEDAWRLLDWLAHRPAPSIAERETRPQHAVAALLDGLGNPQRRLCAIHVAGSKGKGSTTLLVEAILAAAGLRVGSFTSPHLERWTERIRICGAEIEAQTLTHALEALRPALHSYCSCHPQAPTFFDVMTAAALYLFDRAGLDAVVIEVGIGGRLDSTNIVLPRVSCISSIELEHTDLLGSTLQQIAAHKAGVIKPGVPAVIGALPEPALACVLERCAAVGAATWVEGREFAVTVGESRDATLTLDLRLPGARLSASLPVLGAHLGRCAAIALACVAQSGLVAAEQLSQAAQAGLANARLPGRTEVLGQAPWRIVDGAHTPASALALRAALRRLSYVESHWLISISGGKELSALIRILLQQANSVTLTRADPLRSLATDVIEAEVAAQFPDLAIYCFDTVEQAADHVRGLANAESLICGTGSVYLAGAVRDLLR